MVKVKCHTLYNCFILSNTEVWNFYKEDKHLSENINTGITVNSIKQCKQRCEVLFTNFCFNC